MKKMFCNISKCIIFACLSTALLHNANAGIIFQCETTGKKQILLEEIGNKVRYSYGKKNKPEIVFDNPISETEYFPWPGGGGDIGNNLHIKRKGYIYSIWDVYGRFTERAEGGVNVLKQAKNETEETSFVVKIRCKGKPVIDKLEENYMSKYPVPKDWK